MTMFLLRPMLLLAAFVSVLVAGTLALDDTIQHQQELIFVQEDVSGHHQTYIVDQDRGLTMPLFETDQSVNGFIGFSPDGRFMDLLSVRDETGMLVHDLNTETTRWFQARYTAPNPSLRARVWSWSPDSRALVYAAGANRTGSQLVALDTTSWEAETIGEETPGSQTVAWLPDSGDLWVYRSEVDGRSVSAMTFVRRPGERLTGKATMYDMITGTSRSYDVSPGCFPKPEPVISRDGSKLACVVMPPDSGESHPKVFVYGLTEAAEGITGRPINPGSAGIVNWLKWSPDGQKIAYFTTRSKSRDIYILDAATGTETHLTAHVQEHPADPRVADWSPDSKRIAISTVQNPGINLVLYELETDTLLQLTHDPDTFDVLPHWSLDGVYLAFFRMPNIEIDRRVGSLVSGPYGVYVFSLDSGELWQVSQPAVSGSGAADRAGWRP